jgi:hypothetical protein
MQFITKTLTISKSPFTTNTSIIFSKKILKKFVSLKKSSIFASPNQPKGEVGEWLKPTVC